MRTVGHNRVLAATIAMLLSSGGVIRAQEVPGSAPEQLGMPVLQDAAQERLPQSKAQTTASAVDTGVTASVGLAAPDDVDLNSRIPLPAPLDLPPPSAKDVATPAPAATPAATDVVMPAPAATPEKTEAPATAQAPTVIPAPTAETVLADKLRELVTTKLAKSIDRSRDRVGVDGFYAGRQYAPVWVDKNGTTDRAKAAIAYLGGVAAEGLEPSDYPVPNFVGTDPEALAQAELKLTASVLAFARHAQIGRVHFSRVSADIAYEQVAPQPADVLAKMAEAKDVGAALASYNPQHEGYKALKAKLAEARGRKGDSGPARIATGPVLKIDREKVGKNKYNDVFMKDERVPALRQRLGVSGDANDRTYDKGLADAVKKFQREHDLSPTGNLNTATVEALNGPRRDREADIIVANMERWRWLPHDLGKAHVMLNIPDFTLKVMNNGKMVWTTKVVTGKPGDKATPLLSETMKFITVNPTWNVPPSIINNEYLPALQQDPDALSRIGLKLERNRDGSIRIYQPPGERNALGRIRFNFPNKFLVYQHDTPDKHLFNESKRAFSHGCMRVQFPDKYAEVLLGISQPNEGWTVEKLHRMYGDNEQNINLAHPIPVHITYQTAFVDEAGKLQIRDDIYGRDAALLEILKGKERLVADIGVERKESATAVRKDIDLPSSVFSEDRRDSGRGFGGGYSRQASFLDLLFGGGQPAPPPAPIKKQRRVYTR
jgi:murein L,D-transpeptidase YcbB/YkuD